MVDRVERDQSSRVLQVVSKMGLVSLKAYLPRSSIDSLAMVFTFVMIPVAYLHGVFYIAPTIWPVSGVSEELGGSNWIAYSCHVIFMTFLLFNTMANLLLTVATDTSCGRVSLPVVSQPGWTFCPYCQHHTPPRAHHCTTCHTCVLRRDHHCYFAGKCVGYYNHRYFIAFLVYILIDGVYGAVLSFKAVSIMTGGLTWTIIPSLIFPVLAWLLRMMPVNALVLLETSVAMFAALGTAGLLALQLHQLVRGQTLWEYQKGVVLYDHGLRNSLREVMGRNWWYSWLLPFLPSPLPGDGSHFPPLNTSSHVTSHDGHTHQPTDGRRKLVKSL